MSLTDDCMLPLLLVNTFLLHTTIVYNILGFCAYPPLAAIHSLSLIAVARETRGCGLQGITTKIKAGWNAVTVTCIRKKQLHFRDYEFPQRKKNLGRREGDSYALSERFPEEP